MTSRIAGGLSAPKTLRRQSGRTELAKSELSSLCVHSSTNATLHDQAYVQSMLVETKSPFLRLHLDLSGMETARCRLRKDPAVQIGCRLSSCRLAREGPKQKRWERKASGTTLELHLSSHACEVYHQTDKLSARRACNQGDAGIDNSGCRTVFAKA